LCDALLAALRRHDSVVSRKHAKAMCAFRGRRRNLAYIKHAKRRSGLGVSFPGSAADVFEVIPGLSLERRRSVKAHWAGGFPWSFRIATAADVEIAAAFLIQPQSHLERALEPVQPVPPHELPGDGPFVEGAVSQVLLNRYERDRAARDACIRLRGALCVACRFDFGATYGPQFRGLIEVHHVVPLSQIRGAYTVDPATDLVPLCPNCHLLVHQYTPPLTVDALVALLNRPRESRR
jgi:predicted HNH restriction endonuclease